MGTRRQSPPGAADKVKVDLAITPGSFQVALERMAKTEGAVPDVELRLTAIGVDEIRWASADGAFELILRTDGRWSTVYHATIATRGSK